MIKKIAKSIDKTIVGWLRLSMKSRKEVAFGDAIVEFDFDKLVVQSLDNDTKKVIADLTVEFDYCNIPSFLGSIRGDKFIILVDRSSISRLLTLTVDVEVGGVVKREIAKVDSYSNAGIIDACYFKWNLDELEVLYHEEYESLAKVMSALLLCDRELNASSSSS